MDKLKPVGIFLVSYFVLSVLFFAFLPQYLHLSSPALRSIAGIIYPDYYEFSPIKYDNKKKEFSLDVKIVGEAKVKGVWKKAQAVVKCAIQAQYVTLYPAIFFALILCWPKMSGKAKLTAMLVGIIPLVLFSLVDLTILLMYETERHFVAHTSTQGIRKFIFSFLNNSGRQLIAVLTTGGAIFFVNKKNQNQ